MSFTRSLLVFSCLSIGVAANAQVIWDESTNGDLSGDRLAPTSLVLGQGNNSIIASMGGSDKDYVHFSMDSGLALVAIFVENYESDDDFAFMGFQAGTTLTEDPWTANPANLLGWTLWGTGDNGQDLLTRMASQSGTIGFSIPLTGSDFTFWIQQTGDDADYQLNFVTAPVPEPATLAAVGFGLAAFARRKRKSTL